MKKYNHTKTIRLGKPNTQYCSRIDGTVVYINSISWFRDIPTGHKCCVITRKYDDRRLYTAEEFHEEFKELVSREEELIRETAQAFALRIKKAMDAVITNRPVHNKNGRVFSGNEFANYIADKIDNVGSGLDNTDSNFDSTKTYASDDYAIRVVEKTKKIDKLFTYDLVSSPGFGPANVSKPTKLKKGPFYG